MDASYYRDRLEALLREAEADGYRFNVEYEIDDSELDVEVDLDYFFMNAQDASDDATVNSSLIWETKI